MRWQVSRQTALGWRPLGAWPLSAVVGIPLVSQARSRGCSGRWLRRAKTLARVAGARRFIAVRGAALLAGENPRHASCGSIWRRRTRPAEAASQLRTKQSDSLASSASTWSSPAILDDDTRTHAHTHTLVYRARPLSRFAITGSNRRERRKSVDGTCTRDPNMNLIIQYGLLGLVLGLGLGLGFILY